MGFYISVEADPARLRHELLDEALSALPEIYHQVLTLRYLGGMKGREIAKFLGTSPNTIDKRLSRAREKLKEEMITMMDTTFAEKQLQPGFTFRVVEIIKSIRIQPTSTKPLIPFIGSVTAGVAITFLLFNQFLAPMLLLGGLIGSPISTEMQLVEIGEIPVDLSGQMSKSSIFSGEQGNGNSGNLSDPLSLMNAANIQIETDEKSLDRPIASLGRGSIRRVAYVANGKRLAVQGDQGVWLYDAETLTEIAFLEGATEAMAVSFDEEVLVSGGSRGNDEIYIWDIKTQKQLARFAKPVNVATAFAFSPDRKVLAIGGRHIALRDLKSGEPIGTLHGPMRVVWTIAFSPDGGLLAAGGFDDGTISLWDMQTQSEVGKLEGHPDSPGSVAVTSIAFSSDGQVLASAGFDKVIRLWEVKTLSEIAKIETTMEPHEEPNSVSFSPDGKTLAFAGGDGIVRLWEVNSGKPAIELRTDVGGVTSIAFHPNGTRLASVNGRVAPTEKSIGGDMKLRLWNVKTQQVIATLEEHMAGIESLVFSPDGKLAAAGREDGTVELWDVAAQTRIGRWSGHNAPTLSVAFSPDGKHLASSGGGNARVWNVPKQKPTKTYKTGVAVVGSVAFSPDGKYLAASGDNNVCLWNVRGNWQRTILGEPSQWQQMSIWDRFY